MKLRHRPEPVWTRLPLVVNGTRVGVIHDLSTNGIAFAAATAYMAGTELDLLIETPSPDGSVRLRAQATVVRWERAGSGYTIGARIHRPFAA